MKEEDYAELLSTVKDIDKDVDCIRDKLYKRGDMDNMDNFLAGLMSGKNRSLSASEMMAMCNQNGIGGNGVWLLILLFILFGGGLGGGFNRFGVGGAGNAADLAGQLVTQGQNYTQRDLDNLASMIGCKSDQLASALCTINTNITKMAGDVNMSAQQIINSVQAGNSSVISAIKDCCCQTQQAFCSLNNTITSGFSQLGYTNQSNTNAIIQAIQAEGQLTRTQEQNHYVQAQLDARDAVIAELRQKLVDINNTQTAVTLANLQAAIAKIPTTTTTA